MSHRIHAQMASAMETVRKILELTRNPRYAEEEDHTYDDKFGLAEYVVNSAMAAQLNALESLGLDEINLMQLARHVHDEKRSVTLRFEASESCEFVKEAKVELEDPDYHASTQESRKERGGLFKTMTSKHKVITKVTEYHWKVGVSYKLFCYVGNDPEENQVVLQTRDSFTTIVTTGSKEKPPLETRKSSMLFKDVSLTWLLQNLRVKDESVICNFSIDRAAESCRTPRRNKQVDRALVYFQQVRVWANRFCDYFRLSVERNILGSHQPARKSPGEAQYSSLDSIQADSIFVPVLPLMEARKEQDSKDTEQEHIMADTMVSFSMKNSESPLLSIGDVNRFLKEQRRSLEEAVANLIAARPSEQKKNHLLSVAEAKMVLLSRHLTAISDGTRESIMYIEDMLRNQLVSAIGKEVRPQDFEEYVRFHNKKFLGPEYAPGPFCYAIRRPNHYPDGILSIETNTDRDKAEPIESIVRKIPGHDVQSMYFPLNAATTIEFTGERYLHAWIQQRFASSPRPKPVLTARARQFSRFLLLVGNLAGADKFIPKDAIIVQNKDEVIIPLLLNELPTPKEFKDAIASLSPEQQRFAKAYRGMQLESSVFGVCVIQLKPQLEALLGLPPDALTKEIGLTQDLLSLFIDYQIPSDLLSYDGPVDLTAGDKVETVKTYVKRVQEVIDGAKAKQLEEEIQKADMRFELAHDKPVEARSRPARVRTKHRRYPRPEEMLQISPAVLASADCEEEEEWEDEEDDFDDSQVMADTVQPQQMSLATSNAERKLEANQKITTHQREDGVQTTDFTAIPKRLDATFDKHDTDNALHTTIIKTGDNWRRKRQENLLTKTVESHLSTDSQKSEKNKAFDLLDALSRSGSLPIDCGELHVVLGVTHCFENTVMGTVIEDNLNPIEKMEKSTLLIASVIHNVSTEELIEGSKEDKLRLTSLFETSPAALAEKDKSH